ncbi:RNA-binding protein 25-like, partial [Cyclospora cayetanensis]|uniref:RNA-binding protein 25-like n=1 Tax=Cyclospora cayetanensis TaxID=88456 RepID=A0A6P6S1A2_9EIME
MQPFGGMPPGLMGMRPLAPAAAMMAAAQAYGMPPYQLPGMTPIGTPMGTSMAYGMPPAMMPPQRPAMPSVQQPQQQQQQQQQRSSTLYIGNITKHADNDFMRNLLAEFGRVLRWNRQSDPVSGQLAAFGFCEFADPLGAAKCIACLAGLKLQGRALVVNCNDKVRGEIAKVTEERIQATMRA